MNKNTHTLIQAIEAIAMAASALQGAIKRGDFDYIGIEISQEYQSLEDAKKNAYRAILEATRQEKSIL